MYNGTAIKKGATRSSDRDCGIDSLSLVSVDKIQGGSDNDSRQSISAESKKSSRTPVHNMAHIVDRLDMPSSYKDNKNRVSIW